MMPETAILTIKVMHVTWQNIVLDMEHI